MTVRKTLYSCYNQESISLDENVDYGTACAEGRKYATSIALYLKANPSLVGSNIINRIIDDITVMKNSDARGYRVGFCSLLEMMVYRFCCDHDVYRFFTAVDEAYRLVRRRRGMEGL